MIKGVCPDDDSVIFPENKLSGHSKRSTAEGKQVTWLDMSHSSLGGGNYNQSISTIAEYKTAQWRFTHAWVGI